MALEHCPVCYSTKASLSRVGADLHTVQCPTCGSFSITDSAVMSLDSLTNQRSDIYLLKGVLRSISASGRSVKLTSHSIETLLEGARPPRNPLEAIDRLLLWLHSESKTFSDTVRFDPTRDDAVVYARDSSEFSYLLGKARDLGLVEIPSGGNARLSLEGWARVDELRRGSVVSDQAFVAMWFNPSTKPLWEDGIKPALKATGHSPFRIDELEHSDRIDDRIIAEIRRSSLLVADFTGHRGGVYFEAGFGLGLGIPVIWMCARGDLSDAHFDTRQYNHIDWETPEDARARLQARIEALGLSRNLNQ